MTNGAAIGYMILAAKALKLDIKQIEKLEWQMKSYMDSHTEEEAEEVYQNT